jgi:hypothetical protein
MSWVLEVVFLGCPHSGAQGTALTGLWQRSFCFTKTVLLFAAMGLPPLPPLKAVSDPPRVFADRFVGLPSWHAAVLLSTTHAREPKPQTTPTKP